ncbi:MAG: serine--tRNA ligase [Bacteroidota bacterium]
MLTLNLIRTETEFVKQGLQKKHFKEITIVDEILAIDEKRRALQQQNDAVLAQQNNAAKQIGMLMKEGKKAEAESLKLQVSDLKKQSELLSTDLATTEQQQHDLLVKLPNMPHSSVPNGKTPEENTVVYQVDNIPVLPEDALPHWDLAAKYNLIDFELGVKLTGAGFPVYKNKGAKLQRSLITYFLDKATEAGYIEIMPPLMVNAESGYGTGQLPDKEGQMYHAVADDFYLIPTAEVPVTNIYRDVIVKEDEFPIKMTAYTPCFRREAGSYGKDVRGLNRLHQFDKVEIVQIEHPEKSYETLETMVKHVENLLIELELPYRILRLCGGDMSFASALTFDFEVWSAAQKRWLEVSSTSCFESFQTNRMKCRFKDKNGKMQLAHSLNGSALALPRIVASLLENNQTTDGIKIPKALQKYFGAEIIN